MTTHRPATRIFRHRSDAAQWEMVRRAPHPLLARYVRHYVGYDETTQAPMRRIEAPHDSTVLIFNLGPSLGIEAPEGPRPYAAQYRSFFAALHETFVVTQTPGTQRGVEARLTPLGAYRFLGRPLGELANSVVALDDVLGAAAGRFVDRLQETASWEDRFALVDGFIAERIAASTPPSPEIAHAWRRLEAAHGNVAIGDLARDLGWSRKRLIDRFRAQTGLAPKAAARVLRFHQATSLLDAEAEASWVDIAYRCGYYDQAHFNREFRQFAGRTPSDYRRRLLPDSGGVAGD